MSTEYQVLSIEYPTLWLYDLINLMTIKITYFVHGTTTDNIDHISSWRNDCELSELGIQQSIDLKDQIKDKTFDVVFCSDLKRAVDSTKLTFEWVVPIIQDKRLRECNYGEYNGAPSEIVEPLQEKSINIPFQEWESYEDVKIRITEFLQEVCKEYDGKHIAIIAHKAPQLVLEHITKGKTWEEVFDEDRRKTKDWKPWREYTFNC